MCPISGNTYALKTKSKCKDQQGKIRNLSKFINNQSSCENKITGRANADSGAMMKALAKAGCVVDGELFNSFMGETMVDCKKVKAKCSLSAPEGGTYELKSTPEIYLEKEQADYLIEQGIATETFTNLYEDVYNYYKTNPDLVLNNNVDNTDNMDYKNNTNISNDIFNSIMLLLLLYILFKILYKK